MQTGSETQLNSAIQTGLETLMGSWIQFGSAALQMGYAIHTGSEALRDSLIQLGSESLMESAAQTITATHLDLDPERLRDSGRLGVPSELGGADGPGGPAKIGDALALAIRTGPETLSISCP